MPHAALHRRPKQSRRLVATVVSGALVVTGLAVTSAVSTNPATASESTMLSQVNAARANKGLRAYQWNAHLAAVADEQARRMARQSRLFHNPNLASDVGNYRRVGENVGYGPTSTIVQKAFMNSPGHRANILRDYTQIGIAQVRDGKGQLWVAQVFRTPSGAATAVKKPAKKAVAAKKPRSTVKRKAAAKPKVVAKKKVVVKKQAPVKKRPAPVPAPAAVTAPVLTWTVFSRVVGLASLVATARRGFVVPVVQK